jgi:undecaprenyl-diphosphatase
MQIRYRYGALGAAALVAAVVLGVLVRDRVPGIDSWALRELRAEPDTVPSRLATVISGSFTLVSLAILIRTAVHARRDAQPLLRYVAVLALCLATLESQAAFQRPGPTADLDWTYPSGHTTMVAALGVTSVLLATQRRGQVLALQATALVLTAASRVVLGEHYVTDVAGAALGVLGVGLIAATALSRAAPRVELRQ